MTPLSASGGRHERCQEHDTTRGRHAPAIWSQLIASTSPGRRWTPSTTRHRRSQPYDPPDFSSLKAWIHATSAPPAGRTAPSESPAGLLAARGTSRPGGSGVHNCTAGTEAPGVSVVGRCAAAGSKSVPGFPSWLSIIAGVGPRQGGLRLRLRPQDGQHPRLRSLRSLSPSDERSHQRPVRPRGSGTSCPRARV